MKMASMIATKTNGASSIHRLPAAQARAFHAPLPDNGCRAEILVSHSKQRTATLAARQSNLGSRAKGEE